MSLYFVYLRRPRQMTDRRNDPFWEFGTFGMTGCHKKNLLHPLRSPLRAGDQLAFLQGGINEVRVTGLTPPITVQQLSGSIYASWSSSYRPCPYELAPLLIDNNNRTEFPAVRKLLAGVNRRTPCGRAGSRLRTRVSPVDDSLAEHIRAWFSSNRHRIGVYLDAVMPAGEPWHIHGMKQGWVERRERAREYSEAYARLAGPIGSVMLALKRPHC